jgi:hypothetical protein
MRARKPDRPYVDLALSYTDPRQLVEPMVQAFLNTAARQDLADRRVWLRHLYVLALLAAK